MSTIIIHPCNALFKMDKNILMFMELLGQIQKTLGSIEANLNAQDRRITNIEKAQSELKMLTGQVASMFEMLRGQLRKDEIHLTVNADNVDTLDASTNTNTKK